MILVLHVTLFVPCEGDDFRTLVGVYRVSTSVRLRITGFNEPSMSTGFNEPGT